MIPEYLYRFEESRVADRGVRVVQKSFKVIKETTCGYWILWFGSQIHLGPPAKWVSRTTKKRYAYPTLSEALKSFRARKRRQIQILEAQLGIARTALLFAQGILLQEDL